MRSFTPSTKQIAALFVALNKFGKYATEKELTTLKRAVKFVGINGLIYPTEISTAFRVIKRGNAQEPETTKTNIQNVSSYTKKDGTFVRSYVRKINK